MTNLAKAPASTVQILGAEKALFRALKTKGNTPKYGLIFHSSFIGRAAAKNKGRISRYLANKCSIAARIDSFSDIQVREGVGAEVVHCFHSRFSACWREAGLYSNAASRLSLPPLFLQTTKFGVKLRDQVEDRLKFYESGEAPK